MICEKTTAIFPMQATIFHAIVEQQGYGQLKKTWVADRTIACSFTDAGSAFKEEVVPNVNITQEKILVGRVKTDPRISVQDSGTSITNVVVSEIKDRFGNAVYTETAGPRSNKSTIFEVAAVDPFVGPFGKVEYYKVVLRRSENQAVDL